MTPTLAPPHPDDEPQGHAADDVVFVQQGPSKQPSHTAAVIQAATQAAASATVKVQVVEPFRVLHNGEPFVGGDVVEVPGDTADAWVRSGWAKPEPTRKGKAAAVS